MLSRRDALALPLVSLFPAELFAQPDDPTRVFTDGRKPTDVRLGAPRNYNGYFPFNVPKTKEAWEARRKVVRENVLVANGLWPLPERSPLNPVIHGKIDRDGYTIEKVYFASTPGHYLCGNLYRPAKVAGKAPGVLFAHGHWMNGRFELMKDAEVKASVKSGGEPDAERAKYFMQAIPTNLARLGFVVFQYDMIGCADTTTIPHRAGFTDAEAELRLQSFMGLQTWNSLRALDFLESLPDVDPKRLGMTGASGGGTQTFITGALDDRLAAAFPAVMVSTGMQGGCICENCSLLRLDTGNIELAGMMAPKPLAMSAANDWTKEILTKGFPELQHLYEMLGAKDHVAAKAWLEFGHQYNRHAREFMYAWFVKHLQGKDEVVKEQAFTPTDPKDLSVFDATHPRPKDDSPAPAVRAALTKASDEQMAKLVPKDAATLKEFKRVVGTALRAMVRSDVPTVNSVTFWHGTNDQLAVEGVKVDGGAITRIGNPDRREGDAVPFFANRHQQAILPKQWVIWLHPKGKSSVVEGGKWNAAAKALLDAKSWLVAIDTLQTGEQVSEKRPQVDKNYAGYTFGYNRALLAERVRDTLTAISLTASNKTIPTYLVGWGEMGVVAVLAKALAGDRVAKTAADLNQFRFENVKDVNDPMMLPGAVKYGGLPAFLALCAPGEVLAHNHKGMSTGKLPKSAYDAAGASDKLTRSDDKLDDAKVVEWLMK